MFVENAFYTHPHHTSYPHKYNSYEEPKVEEEQKSVTAAATPEPQPKKNRWGRGRSTTPGRKSNRLGFGKETRKDDDSSIVTKSKTSNAATFGGLRRMLSPSKRKSNAAAAPTVVTVDPSINLDANSVVTTGGRSVFSNKTARFTAKSIGIQLKKGGSSITGTSSDIVKKQESKAKLEKAMLDMKMKQALAKSTRKFAAEKSLEKDILEKQLDEQRKCLKEEKRNLKASNGFGLVKSKKETEQEMALQQSELEVANKEAEITEAKLQLARAEQEAAKCEADALLARVEAKCVLEELKQTKAKIARPNEILEKSTSDKQELNEGVQQLLHKQEVQQMELDARYVLTTCLSYDYFLFSDLT